MRRGTMQGRLIGLAIAAVAAGGALAGPAAAAEPTCTNAAVTCVTGTAADGSTYKAEVPSPVERDAAALQPRLPAADRPESAGRHLGQPPGRRRAARARLRARGLVLRHERLGGGERAPRPDRSARPLRAALRQAAPDDRVGRVDGRHDHRRPRRAPSAPLRRRAAVLRHPRRRGRAVEPEPRPRVRDQDAARGRPEPGRLRAGVAARARPRLATGRRTSRAPTRRSPPRRRRRRGARGSRSPPRCSTCPTGTSPARSAPGPRRLRGAAAAGVPRAAVPARVHLRLPPGRRAARRRQPVVEHRRRLRPAARALRQPRRGRRDVRAERARPARRPPAPGHGAARPRRPAGHPLPDPQRRLRRADPRAGADRAHDRRRARRLTARAGVPRHGPARRPRAAAQAAVARPAGALQLHRRGDAAGARRPRAAAGPRPLAAPRRGPAFVGYEPPPFLRPFDLAWPRSNGRQG